MEHVGKSPCNSNDVPKSVEPEPKAHSADEVKRFAKAICGSRWEQFTDGALNLSPFDNAAQRQALCKCRGKTEAQVDENLRAYVRKEAAGRKIWSATLVRLTASSRTVWSRCARAPNAPSSSRGVARGNRVRACWRPARGGSAAPRNKIPVRTRKIPVTDHSKRA